MLTTPVPHQEAIAFLRAKPVLAKSVFDRLVPELKARAFTIAGVEAANVLQSVRDRIAELPEGGNWDTLKREIVDDISPWLVDPAATGDARDAQVAAANRRAELLLRLHGFQAYQAAAWRVMDEQRDLFPWWKYITMEDAFVRPSHAVLDGLVLEHDHPFWTEHFPPWDWGCRCQVIPLSAADVGDVRAADATRPVEARQMLAPAQDKQLREQAVLSRRPEGQPQIPLAGPIDVRSPKEKGAEGAFGWNPADLRLSLTDLQARYDAETWDAFEKFARAIDPWEDEEDEAPAATLWDWLAEITSDE
jgi:SPP1 gp7 family putative phage head morphogenesis protein